MKKFAKLSLVAAVAVAGLSTANASSLEEAIKGVDVSGMVRYRFTESKKDNGADRQQNDYDIELTAKIPVNDMVKAIVKLDVDGDLAAEKSQAGTSNVATVNNAGQVVAGTNYAEPANGSPDVEIEEAYFSYGQSDFVINAGKQALPGPLTDGLNGTGVVVLAPVGPVTLASAYMNASDAGYDNVSALALLGSFEMINFEAWYGVVKNNAKAYNLAADAQVGPANLKVSYAEKETDAKNDKDEYSTLKITAEAELGVFDLYVGYARSGDEGTAELSDGNDAGVNDFGANIIDLDLNGGADLKMFKIGADVRAMKNVKVGLAYVDAEYGNTDANEIALSGSYEMSKNFKISSYYSIAEDNNVDENKGRLELKYTF